MTSNVSLSGALWHNAGAASATKAADSAGKLLGRQAVQVESPLSLLRNAAEELTFSVDTSDEFELEERKERDAGDTAARRMAKLYKQLMFPADRSAELDAFRLELQARIAQQHGGVSEGEGDRALQAALRRFPDPSDAWTALEEARDAFAAQGDTPALTVAQQALETLERSRGQQIRAGMRGALTAADYTEVDDATALRDLYRGTVCDFTSVNEVFDHVLAHYGTLRMEKALDFLSDALGRDLASDTPSMEPAHLAQVNTGLGQVHLLQSAYGMCDNLLTRWENVHGVKGVRDGSLPPRELLGRLVALRQEKFVGSVHVGRITAEAKIPDIEHEVLFLQELLGTVRRFPSQLFDGDTGRMRVLDAVQQAVDDAVEREDAWLATQ